MSAYEITARSGASLPGPPPPGAPHTALGEAAPRDVAQPTGSGENTGRETQEDIPTQHKGPGVSRGRVGTFLRVVTKRMALISGDGRNVKPDVPSGLAFSL